MTDVFLIRRKMVSDQANPDTIRGHCTSRKERGKRLHLLRNRHDLMFISESWPDLLFILQFWEVRRFNIWMDISGPDIIIYACRLSRRTMIRSGSLIYFFSVDSSNIWTRCRYYFSRKGEFLDRHQGTDIHISAQEIFRGVPAFFQALVDAPADVISFSSMKMTRELDIRSLIWSLRKGWRCPWCVVKYTNKTPC
jgi:hypothetical protein